MFWLATRTGKMGLFARFGFPALVPQGKVLFFSYKILYDWPSLFGQDSWILTFFLRFFMGRDEKRGQCPASLLQASAEQWRAEREKRKRVRGGQGTGSLDHASIFLFFFFSVYFLPTLTFLNWNRQICRLMQTHARLITHKSQTHSCSTLKPIFNREYHHEYRLNSAKKVRAKLQWAREFKGSSRR